MNRACIEEKDRVHKANPELPHSHWDEESDGQETLLQLRVREVRGALKQVCSLAKT